MFGLTLSSFPWVTTIQLSHCYWDKVSHSLGWPRTPNPVSTFVWRDGTQGFMHAEQVLYDDTHPTKLCCWVYAVQTAPLCWNSKEVHEWNPIVLGFCCPCKGHLLVYLTPNPPSCYHFAPSMTYNLNPRTCFDSVTTSLESGSQAS